jgi:hypothetical protein
MFVKCLAEHLAIDGKPKIQTVVTFEANYIELVERKFRNKIVTALSEHDVSVLVDELVAFFVLDNEGSIAPIVDWPNWSVRAESPFYP